MTEPHSDAESDTRQISVAELLARNGTIGAPAVTRRRRRKPGDNDAVTVAELTGEIPIIRDVHHREDEYVRTAQAEPPNRRAQRAEVVQSVPPLLPESVEEQFADRVLGSVTENQPKFGYWSGLEPRWPKSSLPARRATGPERGEYPRPLRYDDENDDENDAVASRARSGAERMSPDPVEQYDDISVDVADSEVSEAKPETEDPAHGGSYLRTWEGTLFSGQFIADEVARRCGEEQAGSELDVNHLDFEGDLAREAQTPRRAHDTFEVLWRGAVIVLQSILAAAFGAGLFIAFDQLWRWDSIVALVLSVLVILGLVVGVRVVRKTEDTVSTLIAVAVGALIALGPLALLQSG